MGLTPPTSDQLMMVPTESGPVQLLSEWTMLAKHHNVGPPKYEVKLLYM